MHTTRPLYGLLWILAASAPLANAHDARQDQRGDGNQATIEQSNLAHFAQQTQDGSGYSSTITQDGVSQYATSRQGGGGNSDTRIVQLNAYNTAQVSQTGIYDGSIDLRQDGTNHFATVTQTGSDLDFGYFGGRVELEQTGAYQQAEIFQNGSYNTASVHSSGEWNTVDITQAGSNQTATLRQSGERNGVSLTQRGEAHATLNQSGSDNKIELDMGEYWSGSPIAEITQTGENNVSTANVAAGDNRLDVIQDGIGNELTTDVLGGASRADIAQTGDYNEASVLAYGGNARLIQQGDSNEASILTTSEASITQIGNANSAHVNNLDFGTWRSMRGPFPRPAMPTWPRSFSSEVMHSTMPPGAARSPVRLSEPARASVLATARGSLHLAEPHYRLAQSPTALAAWAGPFATPTPAMSDTPSNRIQPGDTPVACARTACRTPCCDPAL
jgi:hypothetical protein